MNRGVKLALGVLAAQFCTGLPCAAQSGARIESDPPASQPETRPIRGIALREQMVLMQSVLTRIATDTQKADHVDGVLDEIEELQLRIIEAKQMTPPRLGNLSDDEWEDHVRAYRRLLSSMLVEVAQLEMAVIDGRHDDIGVLLSQLADFREKGHERFQPPREERDQPAVMLEDKVTLTIEQRKIYLGTYEFKDVGFRLSVVEREGVLFLTTFGHPDERLFAMGEHMFRVAISPDASVRFDVGDNERAQAILLDGGGGRQIQRIERVED